MFWLGEWLDVTILLRCHIIVSVLFISCCHLRFSFENIVRYRYDEVNFLTISRKRPHSSSARARYGVPFVDPASNWHSASDPVSIYVISYNIRSRYNGTRLYIVSEFAWISSQPGRKTYTFLYFPINVYTYRYVRNIHVFFFKYTRCVWKGWRQLARNHYDQMFTMGERACSVHCSCVRLFSVHSGDYSWHI